MRPGTPGFVGIRLREAREARGLTQAQLAELLSVSTQAISQYETGKASPHPDVVTRLPLVLNLPMAFFLEAMAEEESSETMFWRSMASATLSARVRAGRRFEWFKRLIDYLCAFVALPVPRFPNWSFPSNPVEIERADIEATAVLLRAEWQLGNGPIGNMVHLLENHGAVVGRMALGAETLDAFSQWRSVDGRPYVVLGADKAVAVRSRWDAAHELGHIIAHRPVTPDALRKKEVFNRIEAQAHAFAGAFLLPAATFADDFVVPTLDALLALKMKWNVSMAAMLMRAKYLDLISENDERRFWRSYASKGYKSGEPLDDKLRPESPEIPRQALTMLLDRGMQSRAQVLDRISLPASDVEELAGLPSGFLADAPKVFVLGLRADPPAKPLASRGETTVLPFNRPVKP